MTSAQAPAESWTHGYAEVESDVRLHYVSQGPEDGALMIMLHGFPEFWYSWRHQIPVMDRWAIIAYLRVLQRSQKTTIDDVPGRERAGLQGRQS